MNEPRPRVFVVHEPLKKELNPLTNTFDWVRAHDVSIAREYGDLVYMFPAGRLSSNEEYLVSVAREKLKDFKPTDYLLLAGDTAAVAISTVVASQTLDEDQDHLQLLLWDGRIKRYYAIKPRVWEQVKVTDTVS